MSKQVFSTDFYGKNLTVEVGELAKQANGSVLVRYDDTVILSTAVAGKEPKSVDFFPLTVTYEEKLYSVGKIPGGFLKREGRYQSSGGKELWIYSNGSATGSGSHSFYRTNGGIFY